MRTPLQSICSAGDSNPNERQIGGSHYRASIQHWDLIEDHRCGYLEGCATKYLTRWRKKNGRQDLEKALHYAEKLLERRVRGLVKPRGFVPHETMMAYSRANELTEGEHEAIRLLTSWQDVSDIRRACAIIQQMLQGLEG